MATMRRGRSLGAAVALAALTLAGCGVGAKGAAGSASPSASPSRPSAAALGRQVAASMRKATSVQVSGTTTSGGEQITFKLNMTSAGDFYGPVKIGVGRFHMLGTHGKVYAKVTKSFLKYAHLPSSACAQMCGKYVKLSAKDAKSVMNDLTWEKLVGSLIPNIPALTYKGPATVNGEAAWKTLGSDGTTVYVAAQGTHYLLRVVVNSSENLDFAKWNTATIPPPPPASKIIKG